MYIYLIFITSILGFIRDYSKYKLFSFNKFIRTPLIILIINFVLNILGYNESLLLSLIFERWFFLILKSIISYFNNDYLKKKNKYIMKYKIKYKN